MGIELCVCSVADRRVSRSHDGVELGLFNRRPLVLTSLARIAFAGSGFSQVPPRHRIENGRRKISHRMHFDGMAWRSPPVLNARRHDFAPAVEAGTSFPGDAARLAVE